MSSATLEYVVQRGDTLSEIALLFLDDAQHWRKIAELNNIKSPDFWIFPGQVLLIPLSNEQTDTALYGSGEFATVIGEMMNNNIIKMVIHGDIADKKINVTISIT